MHNLSKAASVNQAVEVQSSGVKLRIRKQMSSSLSLDDYESDNEVAEEKDDENEMSENTSTKPITGFVRTNSIVAGVIFERKSPSKLVRESESMRQLFPRQESGRSNLFGLVSPERFRRGSDILQ